MRTELIEMLVAPNTIVETLDVIEDFLPDLSHCLANSLFDLFALQAAEERFGHSVIPTVTPTAHAPAHHRTRMQVQNSCQVKPALMCADVSDVRYPRLVRFVMLELALQLIRCQLRVNHRRCVGLP